MKPSKTLRFHAPDSRESAHKNSFKFGSPMMSSITAWGESSLPGSFLHENSAHFESYSDTVAVQVLSILQWPASLCPDHFILTPYLLARENYVVWDMILPNFGAIY